jgi:diguanylate cyclase (GGDEF)-like protein/PAS domain S-box-containing protein
MSDDLNQPVQDPARLAALRATQLLDSPAEEPFDRLAQLAARSLHAPVAVVDLVDESRQFFKACVGLAQPSATWHETPPSHSFNEHVVASREPLLVGDAREDLRFKENPVVRSLQVIAYLGVPLTTSGGHVLGSFCVTDSAPRTWSDEDVAIVRGLAESVMIEIELRGLKRGLEDSIAERTEKLIVANEALCDREAQSRELFAELETLYAQAPIGLAFVDHDLRYVRINERLAQINGRPVAAHLGCTVREMLPAKLAEEVEPLHRRVLETGEPVTDVEVHGATAAAPGIERDWLVSYHPVRSDDGAVLGVNVVVQDITERKRTERFLRQQADLIEQAGDAILAWKLDGTIQEWSETAEKLYGYSREQAVGQVPHELLGTVFPEGKAACEAALREHGEWQGELVHTTRDGKQIIVESYMRLVSDPVKPLVIETNRDLTKRRLTEDRLTLARESQERLERLANHDSLTDLPNRGFFHSRLQHAIAAASRQTHPLAVLFIDLDNFKVINDTLGHDVGDQLLIEAAERLKRCVRQEDTLARFGGDEFAVLLEDLGGAREAARTAQRLVKSMSAPFRLSGREMFVSASIGISIYPSDGTDLVTLMKNADTAMYKVKQQGRNGYQFFTDEMNEAALERLFLETGLRRALEQGELFLLYQPIEHVGSGRIVGAEALLRWRHPDRGEISPARFIPVAEETGLIVPIGNWVLKSVCAELKSWIKSGLNPPRIAINCSGREVRCKDLHRWVRGALNDNGISGERLTLELAERAVMEDPDAAIETLGELKRIGLTIAIDDFGTGRSALSYLKRFPIDKLKIDLSFVQQVANDPNDAAIAVAIIAMAHSLSLDVVAEGVETAEQFAFLRSHGCDEIQGHYYHPPLPAQEFEALLQSA